MHEYTQLILPSLYGKRKKNAFTVGTDPNQIAQNVQSDLDLCRPVIKLTL